jgi:hypothetical protein
MGDELIHGPEAPMAMGQGEVIAPATRHLIDFPHDFSGRSPGGGPTG